MHDNLNGALLRRHIQKKDVAKLLGIFTGTFRNKMLNEFTDFTISEMKKIYSTYFLEDDQTTFDYLCEFSEK